MLRRYTTLLLFLVLITTQIDNVRVVARFEPDRMKLVDSAGSSILVRGNAPLNHAGDFDAGLIMRTIESLFHTSCNELIVVSLLNSKKDEALLLQEIQRGAKGLLTVKLIHMPVAGSLLSVLPSWLPIDATGGAWEVSSRIHEMLYLETGKAIYFHCMRGLDRTGLVAGIYSMRYLNQTLEEVQRVNWNVANRKLQCLEEMALVAGSERLAREPPTTNFKSSEL